MKKSLSDLIICIVLFATLSVFAFQMSEIPSSAVGYPMFMLIASYLLVAAQFLKSLISYRKEERKDTGNFKAILINMLLYIVIMTVYIFLIDKVGYILSTVFYIFGSLLFLKVKNKALLILLPLCVTLVMYFVFTRFLMVPLPQGTWIEFGF